MLNEKGIGNALAAVTGAWYVVCAATLYAFTDFTTGLARILFHGIALEIQPFNAVNLVIGLIVWAVLAWITGYVFALLYNKWEKS